MSSTAYKAAAEIRALILNPVLVAGPREPRAPLAAINRVFGGEHMQWDATVDMDAVLRPLARRDGLPGECKHALQAAITKPSASTASRAERALLTACNREGLPDGLPTALFEAARLLPYHAAALGSAEAAARISARSLDVAWTYLRGSDVGRGWLALRAALLWASDAQEDLSDVKYKPRPLFDRLTAFDLQAMTFARSFAAIAKAEEMISDEDAILRGGAGASASDMARAGDLPGLDEDLPTLGAILDAARPSAPASRPAPGLVVVPSLAHLPEPAKSTRDRRDSPRAEFERIENKPLPLLPAPDPHAFAEAGAARAPWLRPVFEVLAQDLVGAPYARIRPTAFVSRPGTGKTAAIRAVAQGLGLALRVYNAAGAADGSFGSTSRQWSTGRGSIPLQTALAEGVANFVVGIDEIEKSSPDRRNGSLQDALLPFLERESARQIFDTFIEANVNLSAVSFIVTANTLDGVPGPLRDRLRILEVPSPRPEHLPIVAANLVAEIRAERGLDEAWLPGLDEDELALLARHWKGGSLRPLRRLVETLVAGRDRLAPRH
ncbi:AAA family ATPase [Methylobacterium ajmalii]|jgi:ATP-dependent Lon protease|uniref:AAA family ATPase n=1 Tax=Methylobacterium ajmalii TaxID=2738439 RepID=UPI00190B402D|nr:AAA family ATPase [Methylobacterium ajmalii]MBK3398059.1 AAA family ATPase [Methylobacterium ajmalii]MBK3406909.1 AAA family ATPase [Methylobacterium ajmalii]MBK3422637.1 AAA family ATPase [Methylobacterium ajmalii]MBZ6416712.1 AAA family ATPase [Methylobacterium sp.]